MAVPTRDEVFAQFEKTYASDGELVKDVCDGYDPIETNRDEIAGLCTVYNFGVYWKVWDVDENGNRVYITSKNLNMVVYGPGCWFDKIDGKLVLTSYDHDNYTCWAS